MSSAIRALPPRLAGQPAGTPANFVVLAGLAALTLTACGDTPAAPVTYIAHQSDFQNFLTWDHFPLGDAPIAGHPAGPRVAYRNHPPPSGATAYPVGTILVKVIQSSPTPQDWDLFAMVKRGGDYNAAGAQGWEFFRLAIDHSGTALVVARGTQPITGDIYGTAVGGGCNGCHGTPAAALHDSILSPLLAPGGSAADDAGHCTLDDDAGTTVPATDASVMDSGNTADGGDGSTASLAGYLRFLNLSRGTGTVRFVAANQPGFTASTITAIVAEGGSSGYIQTSPVAYDVDAFPAAGQRPVVTTDGGTVDGSVPSDAMVALATDVPDPNPVGTVAARLATDVYFRSGCTVVLAGTRGGSAADQTNVRLWRISDIPMRSGQAGVGLVRVVSAIVGSTAVAVDEGPTALAHDVSFLQPLGFRRVCAGLHGYTIHDEDTGTLLGSSLSVEVLDGHPHTLYVWGSTTDPVGLSAHVILTDDLPPGR